MKTGVKQVAGSEVGAVRQAVLECGLAAWLVTDQSRRPDPTTIRPVIIDLFSCVHTAEAAGRHVKIWAEERGRGLIYKGVTSPAGIKCASPPPQGQQGRQVGTGRGRLVPEQSVLDDFCCPSIGTLRLN